MAGNDRPLLVDQDRERPAEFPDRRRDLRDLRGAVGAGVARLWDQARHGPALDAIGRPHRVRCRHKGRFPARTARCNRLSGHIVAFHDKGPKRADYWWYWRTGKILCVSPTPAAGPTGARDQRPPGLHAVRFARSTAVFAP